MTSNKLMREKKSYKNLKMWKEANVLVLQVYKMSKKFPNDEKFGLTSQFRRAALSVVLNIVEGYARRTDGDLRRFLDVSLASLSETEYLIELSTELGYLTEVECQSLEERRELCGKLIWFYRRKVGT